MVKNRTFVILVLLMVVIPTTLTVAQEERSLIDDRMVSFPNGLRMPAYRAGISYQALVDQPTPDNLFSYATDNWAYADELVGVFGAVKNTLISGDKAVMIVAEPVGFVASTVDFEAMTLTAGYDPEADDSQLVITSEFLSSVIRFGDTVEDPDDLKRYILGYYDKEWYIVSYGRRMPYFVIAMLLGTLFTAAVLAGRRGK